VLFLQESILSNQDSFYEVGGTNDFSEMTLCLCLVKFWCTVFFEFFTGEGENPPPGFFSYVMAKHQYLVYKSRDYRGMQGWSESRPFGCVSLPVALFA
jgi:hypothetical protein